VRAAARRIGGIRRARRRRRVALGRVLRDRRLATGRRAAAAHAPAFAPHPLDYLSGDGNAPGPRWHAFRGHAARSAYARRGRPRLRGARAASTGSSRCCRHRLDTVAPAARVVAA
jgi:hypothetical protein